MAITAAIFRLDVEAIRGVLGEDLQVANMHSAICQNYNLHSSRARYELQGQALIESCPVSVYRNVERHSRPHPWVGFYAASGITIPRASTVSQHLVSFLIIDGELYAHSAGQGFIVFERFIDLSFPIEIARRIALPEVKRARSSQISGVTLVNDVNFRDARRITRLESLENVWTALSGGVRAERLGADAIRKIFGRKSKIRLEVSSSIKFGPSIKSPTDLIELIRYLGQVAEESLPPDDDWSILDSIKMLSPRKSKLLIGDLNDELAAKIFVRRERSGLDLVNTDAAVFSSASRYTVSLGLEILFQSDTRPTLDDVASSMPSGTEPTPDLLNEVAIEATLEDEGMPVSTGGSLLAHVHGEIQHSGKTYFILGGRWFQIDASYIELVTADLKTILETHGTGAESIGMRRWRAAETEGEYNIAPIGSSGFINGDRVLTDNVELFDGLYRAEEQTYLIHVKRGFDVKIRDVRSQIISSVNLIENDLRSATPARLQRHWQTLRRNSRTDLAQEEFLSWFRRKRVYILAYGTREPALPSSVEKLFTSRVARMELVNLFAQFGQVASLGNVELRIAWIPIID